MLGSVHWTTHHIALYPGSLGEGEKRAWYLLFAHALNYLTFQSFWISTGTSVLCWRHQPITLLNASAVLLWLWKTNKQLASRPSMKERRYFSGCLQVWQVNVLWSTALRVRWQARKTWQNHWLLKLDKDETRKNPCRTPIVYYNLYVRSATLST